MDRYQDRPHPRAAEHDERGVRTSGEPQYYYPDSYYRELDRSHHRDGRDDDSSRTWLAVTAGIAAGALGVAYLLRDRVRDNLEHPAGDAPVRTLRNHRDQAGRRVTGRTVTIAKPREEVYAFWRDFSNLATFMETIEGVRSTPAGTEVWTLTGPGHRTVELETRIVEDVPNERVVWESVEGASVETRGEVTFKDAPAGRGTEIAADIHWKPPGGGLGQLVMKTMQLEPSVQARRELKRLKMLLETGEIATSTNRRDEAPTGRALPADTTTDLHTAETA